VAGGPGITILGPVGAASAATAEPAPLRWAEDGDESADRGTAGNDTEAAAGKDEVDAGRDGSGPGGDPQASGGDPVAGDRPSSSVEEGRDTSTSEPDPEPPVDEPRADESRVDVGAVVDPPPLEIITLEDLELARQREADADLTSLIAPTTTAGRNGGNGSGPDDADPGSGDGSSVGSGREPGDYGEPDG
jgi:hypothetical protein